MNAFRQQVEEARKVWMEENPGEDGRDHVTPFDRFLYSDTPGTVSALQQEVFEFAEKTFGAGREDAAWKKLFEELGEVLKSPRDPAEWGDVFILLFDLATIYGVQVDEATRTKLATIANRVWNRTETGTFQHVPGAEKAPDHVYHRVVLAGGPLSSAEQLATPPDEPVPSAFSPPGHAGPGCYVLERKDRGMDRKPTYYYKWDPTMECPF